MTRRTYLKVLTVEMVLVLGVILAGVVVMVRGQQVFPEMTHPAGVPLREWLWQQVFVCFFSGGVVGLLLQMIETRLVLKRFARAEAEERARQAAPATDSLATQPSGPPTAAAGAPDPSGGTSIINQP